MIEKETIDHHNFFTMPVLFVYILKLSISLAVVYLFYHFVLRKLTFTHEPVVPAWLFFLSFLLLFSTSHLISERFTELQ